MYFIFKHSIYLLRPEFKYTLPWGCLSLSLSLLIHFLYFHTRHTINLCYLMYIATTAWPPTQQYSAHQPSQLQSTAFHFTFFFFFTMSLTAHFSRLSWALHDCHWVAAYVWLWFTCVVFYCVWCISTCCDKYKRAGSVVRSVCLFVCERRQMFSMMIP